MKNKILLVGALMLILTACSQGNKELEKYGITDRDTCDNIGVLEANKEGLMKDKGDVYCSIKETSNHIDQANDFVKAGYDAERINSFFELPYYRDELTKRYIAYDDKKKTVEEIVTNVNIGLDQPYFSNVKTIENTEDPLMVINKYAKLADQYVPKNLVKTPNPCVIGSDYSCQSEEQFLVKEVADAFGNLVAAGKEEGMNIKAIASYRSYAYQKNLYDYYAKERGQEYADQYYARPGQSEHNSGLAVDVMIDNTNFNEIEKSEHYPWLLKHMSDYGFILRYPEDKVSITGYNYESWHLRYVGVEAAKDIVKQNITLDEYVARREVK